MSQSRKAANRQERKAKRHPENPHQNLIMAALEANHHEVPRPARQVLVEALTPGQRAYDAAIRQADVVFGIGPAGTGKTWFAVQRAAEALKNRQIEKIYVTRPAVEVERGFGFLPGELEEKYAPYLLPLEEAFIEALGRGYYEYLVKNKKIDARPLAFMRGATLKNGWLIADEMQNATVTEFKMLLTRFGEGGKFIINGDPRQIDNGIKSGLMDAMKRTEHLDEIATVSFRNSDIVRHGLVQKIVEAYETPISDRYYDETNESDRAGLERFINAGAERN
jgi:phosphate starvation-inducible PhoH-like protein